MIDSTRATVHIVDDDESVRTALARLLNAAGHLTQTYASAGDFLLSKRGGGPGCLLLDVRMPGPSGIDLFDAISARADSLPVVFLTAHANVSMSVHAMKAGAVDFLEKPIEPEPLLAAVQAALERDRSRRVTRDIRDRIDHLTARERRVLDSIVAGKLNKQIAGDLGTSERTVKAQRASLMHKLNAKNVAQLVQLVNAALASPSQDKSKPA